MQKYMIFACNAFKICFFFIALNGFGKKKINGINMFKKKNLKETEEMTHL